MDVDNQKLKDGIIAKLKEYDAYIDNELPDYIIVMLANKKTMLQIKNDLQLFLGSNTEQFTDWLQRMLKSPELLDEDAEVGEIGKEESKNEEEGSESEEDSKPKVITLSGGAKKERRTTSDVIELHVQESHADTLGEVPKSHEESRRGLTERERHRSRLTLRKSRAQNVQQPDSTRDQDLRAFIAQRREERQKRHGDRHGYYDDGSDSEDEKERVSTSLSSVVKMLKRPQLKEDGGGRLLQRALLGLGRKRTKKETEDDPPKVKVARREEGGVVKRVLKVKKEELNKLLSGKKSPKKSTTSQVSSTGSQEEGHGHDVEGAGSGEGSDGSEAGDQVVIELEREDEEQDLEEEMIEKATLAAVKSVLPIATRLGRKRREPADLRDLISKKSRKTESPSTRFVVTLEGADESYQETDEGNQEEQEVSRLPERCKFWPNCKNGDSCPYAHPSVPCKLFPNCKYGRKCLYVHPQCKFDSRCTRPDCPYLHTAPRHLSFKPAVVPMPAPMPMYKPKFSQSYSYSSGGGHKFPDKSALSWTPNKSAHISERQFAAPDDQTTSLPV